MKRGAARSSAHCAGQTAVSACAWPVMGARRAAAAAPSHRGAAPPGAEQPTSFMLRQIRGIPQI
eukprot:14117489-Heterocapsa_arctica.AAC.1